MDRITLQNYRCFGSEEQSARLAPLTLLVGPNSTGKTSFLALIRALWDVAFREVVPNFREHPYDLGSWDDIVYDPGGRKAKPEYWTAGFEYLPTADLYRQTLQFAARFHSLQTIPFPTVRSILGKEGTVQLKTREGIRLDRVGARVFIGLENSSRISLPNGYHESLVMYLHHVMREDGANMQRPLAGSATRSQPRRTYDPMLLAQDAEGDYIPSYLANLSRRNSDGWKSLKGRLEEFGSASELFDEISVRSPFGKSDGDPFQIQVRKYGKRRKGPWRNLIDVGYGVSQALPVLAELLRPDGPTMLLLQQPEVHLHPQAQAALGTLFCNVAAGGRQLIVETHSDYIIDRVRMDVRDGTTDLKPEDVSILYFEPGDLAVKIHSIRLDKMGNVLDAPPSYGKFFMDEVNRSIGLVKPDVRNR